jgi:hypothetical protein
LTLHFGHPNPELIAKFVFEVVLIGDSNGSLIAYDALCASNWIGDNLSGQVSLKNTETSHSLPATPLTKSNLEKSQFATQLSHPGLRDNLDHSKTDEYIKNLILIEQEKMSTFSHSSGSMTSFRSDHFDFNVSNFFSFGSPLGLVLAFRKYTTSTSNQTDPYSINTSRFL